MNAGERMILRSIKNLINELLDEGIEQAQGLEGAQAAMEPIAATISVPLIPKVLTPAEEAHKADLEAALAMNEKKFTPNISDEEKQIHCNRRNSLEAELRRLLK